MESPIFLGGGGGILLVYSTPSPNLHRLFILLPRV